MSRLQNHIPRIFMLAAVCMLILSCGAEQPKLVKSPDGLVVFSMHAGGGPEGKSLVYSVSFDGKPVLLDSPLGIEFADGSVIADNCVIEITGTSQNDETWAMVYGKSSRILDKYSGATFAIEAPGGRRMELIVRAYNEGIGFRYRLPAEGGTDMIGITGERTGFRFPEDTAYWGMHLDSFTTSYETEYTAAAIENITPENLVAMPALFRAADDVWVAVTEANLTDYAGMYLTGTAGDPSLLSSALSPLPDSSGVCVRVNAPALTPWRVLMIEESPVRLIESNIVLNLNEPCAIDDSWIRPGRTAWDWWSGQTVKGAGFEGDMDNRTMKHYIDFAAEYGLEYMLVDAGWYGDHRTGGDDITVSIPEIDVPELVAYGRERNVDIILWLNWRTVDRQMDEAFPLYESWGVKGVKIDYMNRDDQEMVAFYHRAVRKAAEHHLLVDFHGAYKPTGIRRTWPNLITREGVLGLEYVKWSDRTTPGHDCTIPFTRMLAGPLDYTPGGFTNATRETFESRNDEPMTLGTRCHQLALYVILESPLQMLVDYPENYRGEPGMAFLEDVPVTWDQTMALDGDVGKFVVIARERDGEWWLGAITDWDARTVNVNLRFLGSGDYTAEIYADGPDAASNPESVAIEEKTVTEDDTLPLSLAPGGGAAVRISRAR